VLHTGYRCPDHTYCDASDTARGLLFFSITWVLNNVLYSRAKLAAEKIPDIQLSLMTHGCQESEETRGASQKR
jgi:hypothetical protein